MSPMSERDESKMLIDMVGALARIETKVDTVITGQSDHETRLRAIEDRIASPLRAHAVSISACGSFLSGALALWALLAR